MRREEMIAILAESSGGQKTESEIAAMLERPDPEEENLCVCGDAFDVGDEGVHYSHMTEGY
jgi:hypothetical protein